MPADGNLKAGRRPPVIVKISWKDGSAGSGPTETELKGGSLTLCRRRQQ